MSNVNSISISFSEQHLTGVVDLPASKSISNRVLIIHALCADFFSIENLSTAQDTVTMKQILQDFAQAKKEFNVGHAGTTFRFLTAFLATKVGTQTLTGSPRMLQRPIGPLVDALRQIGADIEYLGEEGFPPLQINSPQFTDNHQVNIFAGMSSQFLSALLLVAPYLPKGLILAPEGKMVSSSYLQMTIDLMGEFGAEIKQTERAIHVQPGTYKAKAFEVESDWSAASYFFGMAAGVDEVNLLLPKLRKNSLQGDQAIVGLAAKFGIGSRYTKEGIQLFKDLSAVEDILDIDFLEFPDLAQTVMVMAALTGKTGFFTGLETLKIKETNRILALQTELLKVGVSFTQLPSKFSQQSEKEVYTINGQLDLSTLPTFATYEDHRMAMAFALLAIKGPIKIENPTVVKKSFPNFWTVLGRMGFDLK